MELRFDYSDGDYCFDMGGNMMMDSDGNLMQDIGGCLLYTSPSPRDS